MKTIIGFLSVAALTATAAYAQQVQYDPARAIAHQSLAANTRTNVTFNQPLGGYGTLGERLITAGDEINIRERIRVVSVKGMDKLGAELLEAKLRSVGGAYQLQTRWRFDTTHLVLQNWTPIEMTLEHTESKTQIAIQVVMRVGDWK
jgi:hypothetical protein